MIGKLLLWTRRNTRKAVALAVAPGLLLLAVDAAIGHFAGHDFDNKVQFIPVVYGAVAMIFIVAAVIPRSRAVFAWTARVMGALGVVVGLLGTALHIKSLLHEMNGDYGLSSLEGALSVAPPVFAPLAFAGVGALLFLLASPRLYLRAKVGKPTRHDRPHVVPLNDDDRKQQVG